MKTKEYLIKNFIPIAKEEAEGLTDVIECLESIEHYLSIPVDKPVKPEIAEGKRRFTEEEEKFIWWGIQWAYRPENIKRTFNRDEFFAYIYSEMDV